MIKKCLVILISITIFSCSTDPETFIPHLEGYWEITEVKKDNKVVKEYTLNTTIDYFEVNDDLSGFRKKVAPNLEGKYIVTQHRSPFALKIEDKALNIYYDVSGVTFKETVKHASEEELVITNEQGFIYTYKPFKQISFE